jgi:hypothetical protein
MLECNNSLKNTVTMLDHSCTHWNRSSTTHIEIYVQYSGKHMSKDQREQH